MLRSYQLRDPWIISEIHQLIVSNCHFRNLRIHQMEKGWMGWITWLVLTVFKYYIQVVFLMWIKLHSDHYWSDPLNIGLSLSLKTSSNFKKYLIIVDYEIILLLLIIYDNFESLILSFFKIISLKYEIILPIFEINQMRIFLVAISLFYVFYLI